MKISFAVNNTIRNKCGDGEFDNLTFNYKNRNGTLAELKKALGKGWATCSALLKEPKKGRNDANFLETELTIIEFDNSRVVLNSDGKELDEDGNVWVKGSGKAKAIEYSGAFTLDDALADEFISTNAALIYTSPSHRDDWHKFRVVFILPAPVTDADLAHSCTGYLQSRYPDCDGATKDRCRAWYGNTNAIFPLYEERRISDEIFGEMVEFHGKRMAAIAEQERHRLEYQREFKCDDADLEKRVAMEALGFVHPRQPGTGTYNDTLSVLTAIKNIWGDISIAQRWSPTQGKGWNIERKWDGLCDDSSRYGVWTICGQAKKAGWKYPEWAREEMRGRGKTEVEIEEVSAKTVEGQMYEALGQVPIDIQIRQLSIKEQKLSDQLLQLKAEKLDAVKNKESIAEIGLKIDIARTELATVRSKVKSLRSDRFSDKKDSKNEEEEEKTAFECDYENVNRLFDGKLRFNTLKKQVEMGDVVLPLDYTRAELSDITGFMGWKTSDASVRSMVLNVANRDAYCPIKEYLLSVDSKVKCDHSYLDDLAETIFGVTSPVQKLFLKITLIGAVKRAFEPGCQHDYMLILYSKEQGRKKSTIIRDLFGFEFAGEGLLQMSNKDSDMILQTSWVHEIPECDIIFRNKDSSEMKAYITRRKDIFRAPYAPGVGTHARRTIMIGTTNHKEFLIDYTGERRWAVIDIPEGFTCNVDYAVFNRDKIFAAALDGYRKGVPTYLAEDMVMLASEEARNYEVADGWVEPIVTFLAGEGDYIKLTDILKSLNIEMGQQTQAVERRVAAILKKLGLSSKVIKVDGVNIRRWVKPEGWQVNQSTLLRNMGDLHKEQQREEKARQEQLELERNSALF